MNLYLINIFHFLLILRLWLKCYLPCSINFPDSPLTGSNLSLLIKWSYVMFCSSFISSYLLALFYCYLYIYWLPSWFSGKESACQAGDSGSIPGSGISPGERNGNPLQYSCLENSTDRGGWWAIYSPWGRKESAEWLSHHLPSPNSLRFAVQYTFLGYWVSLFKIIHCSLINDGEVLFFGSSCVADENTFQ